jgi:hypothetical protein
LLAIGIPAIDKFWPCDARLTANTCGQLRSKGKDRAADRIDTTPRGPVSRSVRVICCDTGRRSASAAFLLAQRGFEVYVLEGGLNRAQKLLELTPMAAGNGVGTSDGAIAYDPPDQHGNGVSAEVSSAEPAHGERRDRDKPDYRRAFELLYRQQKKLLVEREQLVARVRELEEQLAGSLAKRHEREGEPACDLVQDA